MEPFYRNALIVLVLLLPIGGFLLFRIQKQINIERTNGRAKNDLDNQVRAQIFNPDFIFNALNGIQQFYSHIENPEANQYITDLAKYLRINFAAAGNLQISLLDEMERIRLYVSILNRRHGEQIQLSMDINEQLETLNPVIPFMVIGPMVEFSHQVWRAEKRRDCRIHLEFSMDGNLLEGMVLVYEETLLAIENNRNTLIFETGSEIWIANERVKQRSTLSGIVSRSISVSNIKGIETVLKLDLSAV